MVQNVGFLIVHASCCRNSHYAAASGGQAKQAKQANQTNNALSHVFVDKHHAGVRGNWLVINAISYARRLVHRGTIALLHNSSTWAFPAATTAASASRTSLGSNDIAQCHPVHQHQPHTQVSYVLVLVLVPPPLPRPAGVCLSSSPLARIPWADLIWLMWLTGI